MYRGCELGVNSILDGLVMEVSDYEFYFLVNFLYLFFFLIFGWM